MALETRSDGPRVRFAPSPTGYFHVGGARTALFNWLFARQQGGSFLLRIEDTDTERNRDEWIEGIYGALTWLGLDWDEPPVLQSERGRLYSEAVDKLVAGGHVYYCDCTREAVDARTRGAATPGYDGFCRDRGLGPGPGRALRFRTPDEGSTVVSDLVRGEVVFQHATIEDFVLVKSNGAPLFVLANAVDDMEMGVTHVIRGEEHLPNTPKAILVWQALGGPRLPVFAHLPVLVNEKRQKLSKRRDPVALEDYRQQGYLPEAMRNYLVLLGWGPADGQEIMSLDDMVRAFRLTDVTRSPAFFDVRKLTHFDGEYIRAMSPERFIEACQPWLESGPWAPSAFDPEVFARMAPLVQERVATLAEVPAMVDFLFLDRAPDRGGVLGAGRCRRSGGGGSARRRHRFVRHLPLDGRGDPGRHPGRRRAEREEAGQGPGSHTGRRDRSHSWPPAVRVTAPAGAGPHARPPPGGAGPAAVVAPDPID